jgi:hypothetical protein
MSSQWQGCRNRARSRIVRHVSQDDARPDTPPVIYGKVAIPVPRAELLMWQNLWNQGKEDADITDPVLLGRLRNLLRQRNSTEPASE